MIETRQSEPRTTRRRRGLTSISRDCYKALDMSGYRELYPEKTEQEILDELVILGSRTRSMGCYTEDILGKLEQVRFCNLELVSWLLSDLIERPNDDIFVIARKREGVA